MSRFGRLDLEVDSRRRCLKFRQQSVPLSDLPFPHNVRLQRPGERDETRAISTIRTIE
jgi:hypothetical protein